MTAAYLEISEGFDKGRQVGIGDEPITVGRSPANHFCLPDGRASRQHDRFQRQGDQILVEDLGSSNGTYVNGNRLPASVAHPLRHGDEIVICSTRILFQDPGAANDAASGQASLLASDGAGDQADLSVVLTGEEQEAPAVNMTMDASMSMLEIREEEKQSEKGMLE